MSDRRATAQLKREIYQRARGRCEYCCSPAFYAPDPFSVEHIQPRVDGGQLVLGNLALSCQGCNNLKHRATSALDPSTGLLSPLYHPRRDRWEEHFTWSEDFLHVLGLTPPGRATVLRLQLNRVGVVNLRRILLLAGEHPESAGRDIPFAE